MHHPNAQNATVTGAKFLTRCFARGETIDLLLRRKAPHATIQRIVQLETALAPRYLAWLAHENAAGANVASECVPPPNAVLSTSLGKYQILWRVDGFTFEQQESALKLLAVTFGGDPACTDCNRVLRLPGFLNCKYDPAYPVTVEYPGDSTWTSGDFRLDILAADAILSSRAITARKQPANHSIPNMIRPGFCMSLPVAKTRRSSRASSPPAGRINSTLFITLSERLTLHRPDFG
jgi:RepB DNA-primase from phage plasmid